MNKHAGGSKNKQMVETTGGMNDIGVSAS